MKNLCDCDYFEKKGDAVSCRSYRGVKLLEQAMKVVDRLYRKIQTLINLNCLQFGFMPANGIVDAIFIARSMQGEY